MQISWFLFGVQIIGSSCMRSVHILLNGKWKKQHRNTFSFPGVLVLITCYIVIAYGELRRFRSMCWVEQWWFLITSLRHDAFKISNPLSLSLRPQNFKSFWAEKAISSLQTEMAASVWKIFLRSWWVFRSTINRVGFLKIKNLDKSMHKMWCCIYTWDKPGWRLAGRKRETAC